MSTGQFLKKPARAGASALVRFSSGFKLSIALNLVLAALAGWLAYTARLARQHPPPESSGPESDDLTRQAIEPLPPTRTLRWSDIESTEYRTYIANLRNIGCPEPTIRDILIADVHSFYLLRYRVLQRTRPPFEALAKRSGRMALTVLDAEEQQLHSEESAVILALLGPEGSISEPEVIAALPQIPHGNRSTAAVLSVPLVFQGVEQLQLTSIQLDVI